MEHSSETDNTLLKNVLQVFTDPTAAFNRIKVIPRYKAALLILMLFAFISSLINYLDGSLASSLFETANEIDSSYTLAEANTQSLRLVLAGVIFTPIALVIAGFIYHVGVMIQSKTGYSKTFTVIVYAQLITSLGLVISLVILKLTGTNIVFNPLMFLNAEDLSPMMNTLLSYLDIFKIWAFYILFTGFRVIHDMTKKEAVITASIPFLLALILNIIIASIISSLSL